MTQEATTTTEPGTVRYRDVAEFPGYRVGEDGTVWSSKRHTRNPSGEWRQLKPRESSGRRGSPCRGGKRYLSVALSKQGRKKAANRLVHVLVLEAFVGPRPEGAFACHYDGNPHNNRLDNLRWDSWSSNMADMRRHGTMPRGEDRPSAKLTAEDVVAVRRLAERGVAPARMAPIFGVDPSTLSAIIRGKKWKHLLSDWRDAAEAETESTD